MSRMDLRDARAVEYPESDGQPMAETDEHADELRAAVETLRDWFAAADPRVYVAGNNFIYFVEGDRKACVSPDCYVVKDVPNHRRRTFRVWEEGRTPCFTLEVTSDSTRREDMGKKMGLYRDDLQVREYFLFDLTRDWIPGGLRGYRRVGDEYVPIAPRPDGRFVSEELGLELGIDGRTLRFYEPGSVSPVRRPREVADQERARAEHAKVHAEREVARAEQEKARADQEKARAEQEKARADAAESELKRLRAELDRLRGG
jgi:Uma2 family endonuclease